MVLLVADRLAELYADEWSLRRVLAMAKVDASRVVFDHRPANMAYYAAREAAHQGRLLLLVEVMLAEYPLDEMLGGLQIGLRKGREE